ncbi:MAG: glycoside hydrolase family 2 TIM barrel-domain containing protein [Candidatus Moranbacteria bacterium]|nr:glycoside hydrolase family 2 TIM barrel-domain containing protein [Candidatus Moranbacteria bacterium]
MKKFFYHFFKILGIIVAALLVLAMLILVEFNWPVESKNENMAFGVSYSPVFARSLELDWKQSYLDILDGLNVKKVRLASYWTEVEKAKGEYNFSETDWLLKEARERNVKVVLAYGIKVPRWPECFIPDFYTGDKTEREDALLRYESALVERYKNDPEIEMWQVENEPFLPFGDCLDGAVDGDLVDREAAQTKALDSTRPIMVTDSGELSFWYQAAKRADIFGTTLYRTIYKSGIGYFNYPLGPNFFRTKALFIDIFADQKNVIISELQGEPWGPAWIDDMSVEEQYKSMSPKKLKDIAEYARETKFSESYLWGAEWWYWLKTTKNRPEMWNAAREIINGG